MRSEDARKATSRYAIGTRALLKFGERDYRVVCATCDAGGSERHETNASAFHVAARDSNKRCQVCGAA